jgi:hypothetical protein
MSDVLMTLEGEDFPTTAEDGQPVFSALVKVTAEGAFDLFIMTEEGAADTAEWTRLTLASPRIATIARGLELKFRGGGRA